MGKSATQVAAKWKSNLAGSTQAFRDGVNAVSTSPTEQAAAAQDRFLAGVQAAVASGKWASALRGVSLADWKEKMLTLGAQRMATGAAAGEAKFRKFMEQLMPYIEQGKAELNSLPRGDFSQNMARMVKWAEIMHNFKKSA